MRILAVILFVTASGCSILDKGSPEDPVARVFERYLFPSEIAEAIPAGTPGEDSMILAKRYIDAWVKDQLMLHRAEQALTAEQKDFERQLAEYHQSLLIFSYRQKLLQQKLDTVMSEQEISSYYQENIGNFVLGQDVIRGTYIKIPRSAPGQDEVRRWSRSNTEEDLGRLEDYCINYAEKYDDFNGRWIHCSTISSQMPPTVPATSNYFRYNRNIEAADSAYRYYLHITGYLSEGETAPLEMVRRDITSIILNKRKIEFFIDLEQRVYEDGVSRNQFEIYQ